MTYRCQIQNTNSIQTFEHTEHYISLHGVHQITQPICIGYTIQSRTKAGGGWVAVGEILLRKCTYTEWVF